MTAKDALGAERPVTESTTGPRTANNARSAGNPVPIRTTGTSVSARTAQRPVTKDTTGPRTANDARTAEKPVPMLTTGPDSSARLAVRSVVFGQYVMLIISAWSLRIAARLSVDVCCQRSFGCTRNACFQSTITISCLSGLSIQSLVVS
jgi:hypothetical protein